MKFPPASRLPSFHVQTIKRSHAAEMIINALRAFFEHILRGGALKEGRLLCSHQHVSKAEDCHSTSTEKACTSDVSSGACRVNCALNDSTKLPSRRDTSRLSVSCSLRTSSLTDGTYMPSAAATSFLISRFCFFICICCSISCCSCEASVSPTRDDCCRSSCSRAPACSSCAASAACSCCSCPTAASVRLASCVAPWSFACRSVTSLYSAACDSGAPFFCAVSLPFASMLSRL
mmetsp:Transcript_29367/g.73357  ORF Transcript_29367/g.73357 Transcript_29367/m.73357 type:complete len:233 (-) Transcript_29367:2134-2832(-)